MVAVAERQSAAVSQDIADNRYTREEFEEMWERADADLKAGRVVTFTDKEIEAFDNMEQADIVSYLEAKRKEAGL